MYTATMKYKFKPEEFEAGCKFWKEMVLEKATRAAGMVRMQFLEDAPTALAIGTWKEQSYAETFMRTGIFKDLLMKLKPLLAEQPQPEHWMQTEYREGPSAE